MINKPEQPQVSKSSTKSILLVCLCLTLTSTANARSVLDKIDDAIAAMATYRAGDSSEPLELIYGLTVKSQGSDAARRAIAERLVGLLEGSATIEAKIFACKQLHLIGGDESVPVLAGFLANPELAEVALYALDGIRSPAADRALRNALQSAPRILKVSIVHSLAERRDAFSVNTLSGLVYQRDDAIASAAIQALGRIGDEQAARVIARAREGAPGPRKSLLTEALLIAADNLQARGHTQNAIAYYDQLYRSPEFPAAKVTAFRGLADALGDKAVPVVIDALLSDSYELAATACGFVAGSVTDIDATNEYAGLLARLGPTIQPLLLDALAERGDAAAAPAVRMLAAASDQNVRHAALNAVAKLGDASDVALLHTATSEDEAIATQALVRLSGPGVADAIIKTASTGTVERRIPLITALGARAEIETVPALLRFAHDADARIREAAFDACASAGDASSVNELAALLIEESNDDARKGAERALVALSKHDSAVAAGEMAAVIPLVKNNKAAYASVLRALATTEQPEALDALRDAAKSRDDAIRKTAVTALSNWPNAEPLNVLERLAKGSKDDPIRADAFRGYIQLVRLPSDRSTKETVKLYTKAKKITKTSDDKKLLLAGLAEVPDQEALKLAKKYRGDRDVKEEAVLAIQHIQKAAYSAKASHAADDAANAYDNNKRSRWTTRASQTPGQWFQVDLGWPRTISSIELDSANSANDYPRGFEVYLSNDGKDWGDPVAQGVGKDSITTITFKSKKTRYLKVVQTGSAEKYNWSIHEITAME